MQFNVRTIAGSATLAMLFFASVFIGSVTAEAGEKADAPQELPIPVGFTTMEFFDQSRTARDRRDYFGNITDRETARPIQIAIWYPAAVPQKDLPMVVSEYNFPYPEDTRFIDYISEIQNREIGLYQSLVGQGGSVYDILNDEAGAFRDADPAEGTFPLIIYCPDAGHGISENYGLMEYLAARGYIAATIHSVGTFQRDPGPNSADLETTTRDLEFAISRLKEHLGVDKNKIGVMGCGFGADAALLLMMRNYDLSAAVCLYDRASIYDHADLIKSGPFYDCSRFDAPILQIRRAAGEENNAGIVDSLVFARRFMINFIPEQEACLTSYEKYRAAGGNPSGGLSPINRRSYDALCSYTCGFFDAFVKGDEDAGIFWSGDPARGNTMPDLLGLRWMSWKQPPPTESQFLSIISEPGIDTAAALYRRFKPEYPGHIFFREGTINVMGYRYLQSGRIPEALALFELNADAYPNSANVWDSFGEACLATGDYVRALENYRTALEILPHDSTTPPELKTAIENGAPGQIQRIEELMRQSESGENE